MNNIPCLYAIIRFCPFVETGEFANVGIILMSPDHRYFGYKLMGKRHARVTQFFEDLDAQVFKATMHTLQEELKRISDTLKPHGFDRRLKLNDAESARRIFLEVIRPRETVIKFSEARGVLTGSPVEKLKDLYGYYVGRNFVTPEYREKALENGMRKWLYQAAIGNRFERLEVGNDEYHATFPFVETNGDLPVTAIKPLDLAQDQPNKIIDHGGTWVHRIRALKKRNLLPEKVLFAVDGPDEDGPRFRAYEDIINEMEDVGVKVIPFSEKNEILDFVAT